ncbi:fimbrial protein [Photorhabdus sp. SF281]|uniref:fimbrial protein n=1 Tax=Photorhabdus sp. SF281 TaxID=3459527 RepID=UPI0040446A7F
MKKISKISVVAALVLGAASAANAANNTIVNVTGMIVAATCDVTNPGSNGSVDTGNHKNTDFDAAGTKFPGTGILKFIKDSERHFTIGLSNCSKENTDTGKVKLYVTGQTLQKSGGYLFNKETNESAGIVLLNSLENNVFTPIKSESTVPMIVSTVKKDNKEEPDMTNSHAEFVVYIATTGEGVPEHQKINAPITFSYAYN